MVGAADGGQGTGTGDDRSPVATQRPPWNGEHLRQMPAAPQHGGPPDRSCAGHTGQGTGHRERPPNACGIARAPSATGARPVLGVERSQLPSERRARAAFNPAAAVAPASSQAVARTPAGHRPPGKRPGRPWACGSSGSPTLARPGPRRRGSRLGVHGQPAALSATAGPT